MKNILAWIKMMSTAAVAVVGATAANASPVSYDCDVPSNRYSSVTQLVPGPSFSTSGIISVHEMRSGRTVPLAGVRINSTDGRKSVVLQLVAQSRSSRALDIVLSSGKGDEVDRDTLGKVGIDERISFRLSLSDAGMITLSIGEKSFHREFVPLDSAEVMAFCSTGQFKFSDLTFAPPVETQPVVN